MSNSYDATADVNTEPVATAQPAAKPDQPEVDAKRAALVTEWCARVKKGKDFHKEAFKQMKECMALARQGAPDAWVKDDQNYTVPILTRHINQAVATLYAKDPTAQAKRKRRMMNTVWDGTMAQLQQARQAAQQFQQQQQMAAMAVAAGMGHNGGPPMQGALGAAPAPMPQMPTPQLDPNVAAILADAEQVRTYNVMIDRLGKTLELLWGHYMDDQQAGYKQLFKSLVRRTKVCGVGYVKLGFQRALEKDPEITAQISDITSKIASIEATLAEVSEGYVDDDSARLEELRLNLKDLQAQETIVVREGPVFDFPASDEIIIDPKCRNLKTLVGARWYAHEFDMTEEDIQETYKIDICGAGASTSYTEPKYSTDGSDKAAKTDGKATYKVWEIYDKKNQQCLTVCDGYKDFIREPAEPDVWLSRFWNLFPLVFNEVESKDKIYPLSDVWLARHPAAEYNRSRQALREHRIQNRPKYIAPAGVLVEPDKSKLANAGSGELIELQAVQPGQDAEKVLQPMKQHPIDAPLYDTDPIYADMTRIVGATEAQLGQPNGDVTATAETIAATGRTVSAADNVDDLDDMLSALARATGELMLQEISKDTVVEIVGPGAVWPGMPATRDEISKDILLEIKAGSSGRPNQAVELAKFEKAMPFVLQIPGMNPTPFAQKYADLLEIDAEDAVIEGLPAMVAANNQVASLTTAAGGVSNGEGMGPDANPALQGPQGAANAPIVPPAPQPVIPTPPSQPVG